MSKNKTRHGRKTNRGLPKKIATWSRKIKQGMNKNKLPQVRKNDGVLENKSWHTQKKSRGFIEKQFIEWFKKMR